MLIAITGAQGTGKTTLLNELRKNNALSTTFTFVSEITRHLKAKGFEINEAGNDATQIAIMQAHVDTTSLINAIMDRCALDGLVYSTYLFEHGQINAETMEYVRETFVSLVDRYGLIFYIRPEFKLVDDSIRSVNTEFRDRVRELFDQYISYYKLPVIILHGSVEERLGQIYDELKKRNIEC